MRASSKWLVPAMGGRLHPLALMGLMGVGGRKGCGGGDDQAGGGWCKDMVDREDARGEVGVGGRWCEEAAETAAAGGGCDQI